MIEDQSSVTNNIQSSKIVIPINELLIASQKPTVAALIETAVNKQFRIMTDDDVKELEKLLSTSRKNCDQVSKRSLIMSEFSNLVGHDKFLPTNEEIDTVYEKDALYKLQKDCNLDVIQGIRHCDSLDLQETRQIWEALNNQPQVKENMKLVAVGDGGEGKKE